MSGLVKNRLRLLLALGFMLGSMQASALQVHAREVSRVDFTDAIGSFVEHGFAVVEELSNPGFTVYSEFAITGNTLAGQIAPLPFVFELWGVAGQSSMGFDGAGLAQINHHGNSPVLLGTSTLISGSIAQTAGSQTQPPALTAQLNGLFTPTALAASLYGLSAPAYTVNGSFLHYLFVDVSPILLDPQNQNSPVVGFLVNDAAARDVITFTAVPLPGAALLFASAVVGWIGRKLVNR